MIYLYIYKKLNELFKINFDLELPNVTEFHDFLVIIKLGFELQMIFQN